MLSPARQRPGSAAASKRSCVSPASEAALAKAVTGVAAGAGSSVQMSAASAAAQTLLPHLPLTILRNGKTMDVTVQVLLRLRCFLLTSVATHPACMRWQLAWLLRTPARLP